MDSAMSERTGADAPATSAVDVSVIVCAYSDERWQLIVDAVASLQAQTVPALETILVVDHNIELLELARQELGSVMVVDNDREPGAGGARNAGVDRATGRVVAFLDDDATADPHWIEEIIAAHGRDDVLGVGGSIEPRWESGRPRWFPEEFLWVVGGDYRGLPKEIAQVRNVFAANMSVIRSAFVASGGFRRGFGKVGTRSEPEDTELCIRLASHNQSRHWLYWPAARVAHWVPASRSTLRYFLARCRNEGHGKASLRSVVGGGGALSSEWEYVSRRLPVGVLKRVYDALRYRDVGSGLQAATLVLGLLVTAFGFCERLAELKMSRTTASR